MFCFCALGGIIWNKDNFCCEFGGNRIPQGIMLRTEKNTTTCAGCAHGSMISHSIIT